MTLFILDISNLQLPVPSGSVEFVIFDSKSGAIQLQNGIIYLNAGGLKMLDIEMSNNPYILGESSIPFENGVVSEDRLYYIRNYVLNIADLHNPDPPVKVDEFGSLIFPDCVRVVGDVAYVRERTFPEALHLFDVSNPVQAQPITTYNDQSLADLCQAKLAGDRAYSTRSMYDLSDPANPNVLYPFSFRYTIYIIYGDICIEGTTAYPVNSDGLSIFDISVPKLQGP